ncbi:hypothetical protein KKA95_03775 [Patescibacteria group bacterium]|nr:hypothetical protein [Patescibacteria group bacterium]
MKNKNIFKNKAGATFIELLLYIAVFLALTPILLTVSINSLKLEERHTVEKKVSTDSRFVIERVYDTIIDAKRIDVEDSIFNAANGRISLVMQDDSLVIIEVDPNDNKVKITEDDITYELSSGDAVIENLYFEKITDTLNDPDIILGVNMRLKISGIEEYDVPQDYVVSANLENGDYDEDGCPDYKDIFPKHAACCGDADADGTCNELDNCILTYNPFQEDYDEDGIGDECDLTAYGTGGGGSDGGGSPNCSNESQQLELINYEPPVQSNKLKKTLLTSSPLSPTVLNALIDIKENEGEDEIIKDGHFKDIFVNNVKLPGDVYINLLAMENIDDNYKNKIIDAHEEAEAVLWVEGEDPTNNIVYEVENDGKEKVSFKNPNYELGEFETYKTDIFTMTVVGDIINLSVKTYSDGDDTTYFNTVGEVILDEKGWLIDYKSRTIDDIGIENNGNIVAPSGEMIVDVIASQITYGSGGPEVDVYVTLYEDGDESYSKILDSQTDIAIKGRAKYYNNFDQSYYSDDGDAHVLVLQNGSDLPNYDAFDVQQGISEILAPYIDQDGKISVELNQVIILYEFGSLDTSSADFQDLVLLITFPDYEECIEGEEGCNNEGIAYTYVFSVSSVANTQPLEYAEFQFYKNQEGDLVITDPINNDDYYLTRITDYCPGGCEDECGDTGTGIYIGDIFTDQCYLADDSYPEWCVKWKTFQDDDSLNVAYIGGNQIGEESGYWEKTFKLSLSDREHDELKKISIETEIAYQSIGQFYCDEYHADCPMSGNLVGNQNIELYNWTNETWEVIGVLNADGSTSDQQKSKITYEDGDVLKFIGGDDNDLIKARLEFNWEGVPPEGSESAPCFMLIDYFTLHLKW